MTQGIATLLSRNHVGATVLQLVVTEFGAGRLGVAWSDPKEKEPETAAIVRRALRGAAVGASAAVITLGATLALHLATLEFVSPSVSTLFVGAVVAVFGAAKDELLLRGLVLRALGPNADLRMRLAITALAGAAAAYGAGATPFGIAASAALAVAMTALWIEDRGAWIAVGAHAALNILLGPVLTGGLMDVRMSAKAPIEEGPVALVVFAAIAAFTLRRALRVEARRAEK